jgi:surface protein
MTPGKVYYGSTLISSGGGTPSYNRPGDWIAMPSIDPSEQKVAALFLVGDNNSNFVAFRCSGAYTVDWGDGTTENIASNTTAQHNYVYSDLSASTEFGPTGSKSRQAMIVITPQAGQNLTAISFNYRHSALSTTYITPILEILLSAPNCTSLLIGHTTGRLFLLEQCTILSHNTTSMLNLFSLCSSLQSVPLFDTSNVTNMQGVFTATAIQSVPLFDTSSVTNMTNMFQNCSRLRSLPLFDTSSVTNMSSMLQGTSIDTLPLFDTSSVTSMTNMLHTCVQLLTVPLFDTSSVTNMSSMFAYCRKLQSVPLLNTSEVWNASYMFQGCTSLKEIPAFNTSAVTQFHIMFNDCHSLQTIPALNMSSGTNFVNFALSCNGLKRCQATGISRSVTFANCTLGPDELNEIYTNLATVTGQTITVTGNYGAASDNPAIATAKGWTVVG